MADVYEANDMRLGRSVAVKIFRQQAELTGNEARQEREIQVLARLQHPNIVSVFDAGTQGALSFVEGAAGQHSPDTQASGGRTPVR
jgi:eukaryotic-like serine/threonine-protein kinase